MEVNTNEEFYPKLGYVFIEMPKFSKAEGELETELDEWLYILNNLKKLAEIPVSLRDKGLYKKVFELAEFGNLTPEEMNEYQQSLKIQRDNNSALSYAKKEGVAEGLAEGEIKGEHKKALEIALEMKRDQLPSEKIAKLTKLSIEEIEAL